MLVSSIGQTPFWVGGEFAFGFLVVTVNASASAYPFGPVALTTNCKFFLFQPVFCCRTPSGSAADFSVF